MEAKAVLRNVRISPRKVRLVLDLIRGQKVSDALSRLKHAHKGAVDVVVTLLESAVANAAVSGRDVSVDSLVVARVFADAAPTLKRFRPRAMGRASRINKRSSHVTIVVCDELV